MKKGKYIKYILSMTILCVMGCIFASSVANAGTYYVSTKGNDAYGGSATAPWRTIQKCANTINGGDTCIVADGTYAENVTVSRSGSSALSLYIKADNRHQAVVNGNITISNTGQYVKIEGLKVVLPDGGRSGISVSGNYNYIVNNYITTDSSSLGQNSIAFGLEGHYNLAEGNYVEKTCFGYYLHGSNNTFQNNEAALLKLNGSCGDVDYMRFFGANHLIKNNYFHGINMKEIGAAHVDCFQTFANTAEYSATDVILEDNYCTDAMQGVWLEDAAEAGGNITIRNNVFWNVGVCGGASKTANVKIYNNTCLSISWAWLCRSPRCTCEFKNNIFYTSSSGNYAVTEGATFIDGTEEDPGKNNLIYSRTNKYAGHPSDIKNVDPQFVNINTGNLRVQSTSPAINAGYSISAMSWPSPKDKNGVSRPQGPYWDIGAYEYTVTNIGPPINFRKLGQ